MRCPKCKSKNAYVSNTFSAGDAGSVQRRICDDCGAVFTTAVILMNVDPPLGQGAKAIASRLRKKKPASEGGQE